MLEAWLQFRHRRFRRDLSAYVDDVLPERARRRLEAHLDSCQACRQELAELRATVEALGSLPMAEVPRSFALAAAPVAEVSPRPMARRLEFGLRLATATAAFALALVVVGDFADFPGGGEEEEAPAALAPATEGTPAAMEAAPEEMGEAYGITEAGPRPEETPALAQVAPEETPPPLLPSISGGEPVTPAPEETPPVAGELLEETPAPAEAAPVETPEPSGITEAPGVSDVERAAPAVGAEIPEEEALEKDVTEGAEVQEEAEAGAAEARAVAEEEGGGLSREEAIRWLEIGLGAGVGILVVLWVLARLQRGIGNRS